MQIIYDYSWLWLGISFVSLLIVLIIYETGRKARTNEYGGITENWDDEYHDIKVFFARVSGIAFVGFLGAFLYSAFLHFMGNQIFP